MNKAVEIFTRISRTHNCAQAVAAGFGDETLAESLKTFGGGNAPGGRCGALHAALCMISAGKHDLAAADFAAEAGSELCREIKSKTPPFACVECVRLAADLVEKYQ